MSPPRVAVALVAAWLLVLLPGPRANAQVEAEVPAGPPRGVRIVDLTATMRNDSFNTIGVAPYDSKVAYVGSSQGRIFRTTDGGLTWLESTAITERRALWQVGGETFFLGRTRAGAYQPGLDIDLARGSYQDRNGLRLGAPDPLQSQSASASGGLFSSAISLSRRAPRLSSFVASKGRPTPSLSRTRMLYDRGIRQQAVTAITPHPSDPNVVFAATMDGLFRSHDGGTSWTKVHMGTTFWETASVEVAIDPRAPRRVFLGTAGGLWVSRDEGESFVRDDVVPGWVNAVVFDPSDARYIYVATSAGVLRSSDGGKTYQTIYYSTIPKERDVRSLVLDPADPSSAMIGTGQGVFYSHDVRAARGGTWRPLASMNRGVFVFRLGACSKHKGHFYAATRGELPTINYGAAPPESAVFETWDGGESWRPLVSGRTRGEVRALAVDPNDPDQVWVAWSHGVFRAERGGDADLVEVAEDDETLGPTMAEMIQATLANLQLDLGSFTRKIAKSQSRSWLPRDITVRATAFHKESGEVERWVQYPGEDKSRSAFERDYWQVTAWATWSLPQLVYNPDAVPMLRASLLSRMDMLRGTLTNEIYVDYGELRRLRAIMRYAPPGDLAVQAAYAARMEQLEASIDHTSGGFLSRWDRAHRRPD